jgi:hypothetical protein
MAPERVPPWSGRAGGVLAEPAELFADPQPLHRDIHRDVPALQMAYQKFAVALTGQENG